MERYASILDLPRPKSAHPKMDLGNRANQFVPMDALRGFSVAVLTKQREKQLVTRVHLSEDAQEILDRKLRLLHAGDTVTVTHFRLEKVIGGLEIGTYLTDTAPVEEIDIENRALVLADSYVPFMDIHVIESEIFDKIYEDGSYAGSDQT